MNEINPKTRFEDIPARLKGETPNTVRSEQPASGDGDRSVGSSRNDVAALHRRLVEGDNPVATRRDLVNLNKNIAKMLTTVNAGLSDQTAARAADDRRVLSERLDDMRDAVNEMEGLLRIEMAPRFRMMLNESLEEYVRPRRAWVAWMTGTIVFSLGIAIGTAFATEIEAGLRALIGWVSQWV